MAVAEFSALRKFVSSPEAEEHCDMCGTPLAGNHQHMFDPAARRVRCACDSCLILYQSVYKRIPQRVSFLSNFQLDDGQWDSLAIPISLAFFFYSTPANRWVALYPGPAGAAESLLSLESWNEIAQRNSELGGMQADVEALLVNRLGSTRDYLIAPIDDCYRLVGITRLHWRGLAGGPFVWGEIARFFSELKQRGTACST